MRMSLSVFAVIASLFFSNAAHAQAGNPIASIPLTQDFIDIGGSWNNGHSFSIWVKIITVEGRYAVCAATRGVRSTGENRALLQAHKIMLNGRTMLRGLRWAPNYTGVGFPQNREAECRITNSPAVANPSFDVELARTRF